MKDQTPTFPVPHRDANNNPQGLRSDELDRRLRAARVAQGVRLANQIGDAGATPGAQKTPPAGRDAPDAPKQTDRGAGR